MLCRTRIAPAGMSVSRAVVVLALLAACGEAEEAASPEVRPVRVVTIEERAAGDAVSLTGTPAPRWRLISPSESMAG
jgi:membrane fusion protein, multidrug efflux system